MFALNLEQALTLTHVASPTQQQRLLWQYRHQPPSLEVVQGQGQGGSLAPAVAGAATAPEWTRGPQTHPSLAGGTGRVHRRWSLQQQQQQHEQLQRQRSAFQLATRRWTVRVLCGRQLRCGRSEPVLRLPSSDARGWVQPSSVASLAVARGMLLQMTTTVARQASEPMQTHEQTAAEANSRLTMQRQSMARQAPPGQRPEPPLARRQQCR